jgi:hypothetical protein
VDLEKRLVRVEKGIIGLLIGLAAVLALAVLAFVLGMIALFYRPAERPDPDGPEQAAARQPSYLEELERLEALKAKGALTAQEFDARKQQLLAAAPPPPAGGKDFDMEELDKLLRNAQGLYNKNIINGVDYQAMKQQYLRRRVAVRDLTKDLGKAQKLYDDNIINGVEFQALKKQILAGDPALGKK